MNAIPKLSNVVADLPAPLEIQDSTSLRAVESLRRNFGKGILEALADDRTTDIMLNPDGQVWVKRLGEKEAPKFRMSAAHAKAAIQTLAGLHAKTITSDNPIIDCTLPVSGPFKGERFAGQLPPIVSAPTFAIRKKALFVFTLDQFVEQGVMTAQQCAVIKDGVRRHANIVVVGGTGSGKTTLSNAVVDHMVEIDRTERFIVIEDTAELQCVAPNKVSYLTSIHVSMTDLLKVTLRMFPSRILVGEVRGPEALDLIDAWNTGHPGGIATLHADSPALGLERLVSLVTRHPFAPPAVEPLIGSAVQLVIFIAKNDTVAAGRRIESLLEVSGYSNGQYITKTL